MALKNLTKQLIADKTYELLLKKPITKLTVVEIAAACEITPHTLYNHFRDKYEIVQYICIRMDEEHRRENPPQRVFSEKTPEQHFYFFENAAFFRNVLCYHGQNDIYGCLAGILLKRYLEEIRQRQGSDEINEDLMATVEYYCHTIIHGLYAMLTGRIPCRFQQTESPALSLYWPPLMREALIGKDNAAPKE